LEPIDDHFVAVGVPAQREQQIAGEAIAVGATQLL
jgi:hypothetical protein